MLILSTRLTIRRGGCFFQQLQLSASWGRCMCHTGVNPGSCLSLTASLLLSEIVSQGLQPCVTLIPPGPCDPSPCSHMVTLMPRGYYSIKSAIFSITTSVTHFTFFFSLAFSLLFVLSFSLESQAFYIVYRVSLHKPFTGPYTFTKSSWE